MIPGQPVILQDGFSSGEITHTHLASVQDHGVTIGQIGMTYFTLPTGKYRETIGWCRNNPLDDHGSLLLDAQKECNLLLFYSKMVLIDGFSFSSGRADILLGWYRPKIAYWFNSDFYHFIPSVLLTKIRRFTVACSQLRVGERRPYTTWLVVGPPSLLQVISLVVAFIQVTSARSRSNPPFSAESSSFRAFTFHFCMVDFCPDVLTQSQPSADFLQASCL